MPRTRAFLSPASLALLAFVLLAALPAVAETPPAPDARFEELRIAATQGDVAKVKALLDQGMDVNAKSEYGATALSFAADKGQTEVVKLLLERGAKVDVEDTFYGATPVVWAASNGRAEVVKLLVAAGASGMDAISSAVDRDKSEVVRAVLATGKVPLESLSSTLAMAQTQGATEVAKLLQEAGVKPLPPANAKVAPEILARYVGKYSDPSIVEITISLANPETLLIAFPNQPPLTLGAVDDTHFRPQGLDFLSFTFEVADGKVTGVLVDRGGNQFKLPRVPEPAPATPPAGAQGGKP